MSDLPESREQGQASAGQDKPEDQHKANETPPEAPPTGDTAASPQPPLEPQSPPSAPGEPAAPAAAEPPPSPPAPQPAPADTSADVDREVAEAMASMDANDLAELGGGISVPMGEAGPGEDIEPNTQLTGSIVGTSDDEVFLEFGVKSQGVLPRSQFGKKEKLENGRRVDVVVERFDRESGLIVCNRKGESVRATWTNLVPGTIVTGRVTGLNKGGLEVDLSGIRAFMPASQVDLAPMKDISVLLNEQITAEVLEVDRRSRNVLVSRRKVLEKERSEAKGKTWEELEVGQVRKGTVARIMDYGAFIDLGGVDGLVHVSDISYGSVDKVSDHLKEGQEVEVQVLKLDRQRDRISLGMKQVQPDPWTDVTNKYPEGSKLKVRVVRVADFGAFAELEDGIEGLIPVSEMGWTRVRKPSDVVSKGDMVDVAVLRVEPGRRRIALSMKQAEPDPWQQVLESFPEKSLVKGKVTRLADFGVFVELVPGVEGLIHISELSDQRVRTCSDVCKEGDEVETRVLGVDLENRRISLSIKAVKMDPDAVETAVAPTEDEKPGRKRKRPTRGGLESHFDWGGLDLDKLPD